MARDARRMPGGVCRAAGDSSMPDRIQGLKASIVEETSALKKGTIHKQRGEKWRFGQGFLK